mgnify:CR=1 FL=1
MKYLALSALLLSSCARYDDFSLPRPQAAPALKLEWQLRAEPVITRGDSIDVLNPSVVRWRNSYLNLYSVFDGKGWHTDIAASEDGLNWRRQGRALDSGQDYIAANGGVIAFGQELLYAYQMGQKGKTIIGLARSTDGRNWTRQQTPILSTGPRMSWDEISLGDPYLIAAGGDLYLFYLGEDRARRQRLGIAKSHDGVVWTKLRGPILELGAAGDFDENGLGEPAVFEANGGWVMLYTGRDRKEKRAMGYAISTDGRNWVRGHDVNLPSIFQSDLMRHDIRRIGRIEGARRDALG